MYLVVLLFVIYISLLIFFIIGTILFKSRLNKNNNRSGVSVIVSIRNGENAISNLINYLEIQNYEGPMEFILIDDESTDNTKDCIIQAAQRDARFKYLSSKNGDKNLQYKKRALDLGIKHATYRWLMFTDVDCKLKPTWVKSMARYFNAGYEYIVGSSVVENKNLNFVSNFQKIEFLLLMIICRASSWLGSPWASSGQNQAYTKDLYNKVGGFRNIKSFIGDDTAFLQLCKNKNYKIYFNDDFEGQTECRKEGTVKGFLLQRARWVSDANKLWKLNLSFFFILIFSYLFFVSMTAIALYNFSSFIFLILVSIKIVSESILIILGSSKLNVKVNTIDILIWNLFHIPYIIIIAPLSYLTPQFKWRGRKLNKA